MKGVVLTILSTTESLGLKNTLRAETDHKLNLPGGWNDRGRD